MMMMMMMMVMVMVMVLRNMHQEKLQERPGRSRTRKVARAAKLTSMISRTARTIVEAAVLLLWSSSSSSSSFLVLVVVLVLVLLLLVLVLVLALVVVLVLVLVVATFVLRHETSNIHHSLCLWAAVLIHLS